MTPDTAPILSGSPNFRDAGGWAAAGGARVRRGRFYRSPALALLAAEDAAKLEALDPFAIIDFRGVEEAAMTPSVLPGGLGARRRALPVEPRAGARLRALLAAGALTDDHAREAMIDSYRAYVDDHSDVYAEFLRIAAAAQGRPIVFHCTAGKDRTGFAAALLLSALGVSREDVFEDYLRTNGLWSPPAHLRDQAPAVAHGALFRVEAPFLEAALTALEASHGAPLDFARSALGADAWERFAAASLD